MAFTNVAVDMTNIVFVETRFKHLPGAADA